MSQAGKDAAKHFYKPKEVVEEAKEAAPDKSGVCFKCGHGSWTMKTRKGVFYRKCKACGEDQPEIT